MSRIILNEAQKVSERDNYEYKPLETSSQYLTISVWPCLTARCSGYNRFLLATSTVQPNAQRVCATVRSPSRDARWI